MLKSLLAMDGHLVDTAGDGVEGLDLIQRTKPQIALIDIGLPELDGFELARRLRSDEANSQVFLTALTGYGLPADREKALASGFDAHLVKPLNMRDLDRLLSGFQNDQSRDDARRGEEK